DLVEPLEGVGRMLAPPHSAPLTELAGLVWESRGTPWRRDADRAGRASDRPWVDPGSEVARLLTASLRLLQLPRTTPWTVRDDVPGGVAIVPSWPAGVALAVAIARDTPRSRYLLGRALEATRPGHILPSVLDDAGGTEMTAAVRAAF